MSRGKLLPPLLAACALLLVVSVALPWPPGQWLGLGLGSVLAALHWRETQRARANQRSLLQAFDGIQAGIALFDADDRLIVANLEFRRLYARLSATLIAGVRFEDMLRAAVHAGLVPAAQAAGTDGEAWIAARLARHRAPDATMPSLRRMDDGRWRRITEQRLPDGNLLSFSIDVTELVEHQEALVAARTQAERAQTRLREAIEAMPAAVEVYDEDDHLVIYNQRLAAMYPHVAEEMAAGQTFEALLRRAIELGQVPAAGGDPEAWLAERLAQRGQHAGPLLQQASNGAWFHVYETRTASGVVVGVRLDVTELVQQREALRDAQAVAEQEHEALEDAIEALPEGFALFDAADRLVLCNQRYREIYPSSVPAMLPGARFEDIVRYGLERGQYPQAAADPAAWLADRLWRHRNPSGEPILQHLGDDRWLRIDERKTRSGGIAGVRTDVTEMVRTRQKLEALNATLRELSTIDPLTGIGNRRLFDERVAEELRRAQRTGKPLALLLVDIDHFKRYNDRYGHPAGDTALRQVAELLAEQARRPGDLAARYGGEEFVLLLPNTGQADVGPLAERCLASVAKAAIEHGDSPTAAHLTLSMGAAIIRPKPAAPPPDPATLVARADEALYEAKQSGRNRVVVSASADG